jgi:type VI secretion system protein ImpK
MTLLELCEPLFLYVCRLSRSGRKGGRHDMERVHEEIEALLQDLRSKAATEASLAALYDDKLELALIFFVDFMIIDGNMPWAKDWQPVAFTRREMAGDEKFFDLLEDVRLESGEAARERLAVFYTCMGLGFSGMHKGEPDFLRRKMLQCSDKMKGVVDLDESVKICKDAYNPDTRPLGKPPTKMLAIIGIVLVGLLITLLVVNTRLFNSTVEKLKDDLQTIKAAFK